MTVLILTTMVRAEAQTNAFTYQGSLSDGGHVASGTYDLVLKLFDDLNAGNQIGPTITNAAQSISNGLFSLTLNFGSDIFNGQDRWLEIAVRTNGSAEPYVLIAPRQKLTPAPYASFAARAGSMTNGIVVNPNFIGPAVFHDTVYTSMGEAAGLSLSLNTESLPGLQRAALRTTPFRFMWIGDSIAGETMRSVGRLFESFSAGGLDRGAPFLGYPWVWGALGGPAGQEQGPEYWSVIFLLTNTATLTWAGPAFGGNLHGDTLQVWYIGRPTCGTFLAEVSADNGGTWTPVGTVDTSLQSGLTITNFSLPVNDYTLRLTSQGGGSEDRVRVVWATILDSKSKGARLSDCQASGLTLDEFVRMGTNNIMTLFTNLRPDILFCQQFKAPEVRSNWPAIKALLNAAVPDAQICLISSHPTQFDPPGTLMELNLLDHNIAATNGWAFVDVFTPCGSYDNVRSNGWSDDGIHFNEKGSAFEGDQLIRQLGLSAYLASQNALISADAGLNGYAKLSGGNEFAGTNYFQNLVVTNLSFRGALPNAVPGSGAGTSGTATASLAPDATDYRGTLTLTSGSGPSPGGRLFTVNFTTPFESVPHLLWSCGDPNACSLASQVYPTITNSNFSLSLIAPAIVTPATSYTWSYLVVP